jgi:hypothetical protein
VPVGNPKLLGDPHAYWSLTERQQECLDEYVGMVTSSGVQAVAYTMQSVDYHGALLDLIEHLQPMTAYVPVIKRGPALWRRWRRAALQAAFAARGCALIPVDTGTAARPTDAVMQPKWRPIT